MISTEAIRWLKEEFSSLEVTENDISGSLQFLATYNSDTNQFLRIKAGETNPIEGILLSGSFQIRISKAELGTLPRLWIDGISANPDRHINPDHTACLCSPLIEDQFFNPELLFESYIEELVIPFLYGQLYYAENTKWPWFDLAHGSLGLLESYYNNADSSKALKCVQMISVYPEWARIKPFIISKNPIKGYIHCFCSKQGHIRLCHHNAWLGLEKLRQDCRTQSIPIPEKPILPSNQRKHYIPLPR